MAKITEDMVTEFNGILDSMNCSFKIGFDDRTENPQCQIVPANSLFIDSSIINLTSDFYSMLENFFTKRGVEISYNNTRSIFWSKTGWDHVRE